MPLSTASPYIYLCISIYLCMGHEMCEACAEMQGDDDGDDDDGTYDDDDDDGLRRP